MDDGVQLTDAGGEGRGGKARARDTSVQQPECRCRRRRRYGDEAAAYGHQLVRHQVRPQGVGAERAKDSEHG